MTHVRTARCLKCGRVRKLDLGGLCYSCYKVDAAIRREIRMKENQEIVVRGVCPQCGAKLRTNLALAGWWQCEQYGADGFRKDSSKPACSFQCFTE